MKKILTLILALAMIFALCACGKTPAPAAEEQPAAAPTPTPYTIVLYKGDDNAEHLVPVECHFYDVTAQMIADKLCELGVFKAPITVNSCQRGDVNILELDMGEDFASQIRSTGTAGEFIMMGSLVNSFLNAFGADGVLLTVDGETFESGHNIYDQTLIAYAE